MRSLVRKHAIKVVVMVFFLTSGVLISAQVGVGQKYGARDPIICKSKREPTTGAPTPLQVARYFACEEEGEKGLYGTYLVLLKFQQVEVGKARRFNPLIDRMSDADADSPVYPIRGSYAMYFCYEPDPPFFHYPKGRNCDVSVHPRALGDCYKTTFGDWSCSMYDSQSNVDLVRNVPPPR